MLLTLEVGQMVAQVLHNLSSPLQVLFHRVAVQLAAGQHCHRALLRQEVEDEPPECRLQLLQGQQRFDLNFLKDPMNYM